MFLNSIRWRIQIWHTLLLTAIVTTLLTAFYQHHRNLKLRYLEVKMTQHLHRILRGVKIISRDVLFSENPQWNHQKQTQKKPKWERDVEQRFKDTLNVMAEEKLYLVSYRTSGQILFRSDNAPQHLKSLPESHGGDAVIFLTTGDEYRIVSDQPGGSRLVIGTSKGHFEKELRDLAFTLIAAGSGVVVLGVAIGWVLTGRSLEPIRTVSKTAREIANDKRGKRIEAKGTSAELSSMVQTLNQTFEELDQHYDQQLRFMADASHEMRTPVAAVLAKAQHTLNQPASSEADRDALKVCVESARHMRTLIESLLDLSRMDSGELELMRAPANIADLGEESLDLLEALAEEKEIELIRELIPVTAEVDSYRIRQVIINLLSNAIKYNREGGSVTLTVMPQGERCLIRISDTGPGISQEDLPHVFERFYRSDKARTNSREGSVGLGLAITKAIVEAHGGKISVESKMGVGTVFLIIL